MNPIFATALKVNSDDNSYYGKNNLLKQLAIYNAVGVVRTLIALVIMMLPYPIFAMRNCGGIRLPNDLLEDISLEIVHPSRSMSSSTFAILKRAIEQLMEKYPIFYGNFI
ncbi:unnamed protein product [Peronospora effusa]|nr:unnamed protein product [Peronospora effusa]